ncbi:MAG: hypothetical protein RL398_1770 [Planctomycetota bacterium]|jgi:Ca-activated chloride channel family protein
MIRDLVLLDPWLLAFVPAVLAAAILRARTKRAAAPTAAIALFADLRPTLRRRAAWLPTALKVAAGCLLALALARPALREPAPTQSRGIDILLVLDVSSSMTTEDMSDTERLRRMDAARTRAEEFAAARGSDRVGLVVFSRYAELRCPSTLDETALAAFLRVVDTVPQNGELDGTAIGTGLAKAVQILRKSDAATKLVVLLSDGENTVEDILPADGAKLAADEKVRVHTIGLGRGMATPFGYRPMAFTDLKKIAETTGGKFFSPKSDADLGEVYAEIDLLEKSELADPRYRTVDHFEVPLAVGLALLLLGVLLEATWLRRVP